MQKDRVRLYALARELNIETKDLLDLCRGAGLDVKNQLSSLDPDQRDMVEQLVKKGAGGVALAAPPKVASPVIPVVPNPIPNLSARPVRRPAEVVKTVTPSATPPAPAAAPLAPAALPQEPVPAPVMPLTPAAKLAEPPAPPSPPKPAEAAPTPPPARVPDLTGRVPSLGGGKVPDLGQARPDGGQRTAKRREIPRPHVVVRAAPPPSLKPKITKDLQKAQEPVQRPIARPPLEGLKSGANVQEILNKTMGIPGAEAPANFEDEEDEAARAGGSKVRPGGVAGREKRHQQRTARARLLKDNQSERRPGELLFQAEDDRPQRLKQRLRQAQLRQQRGPTQPRKGKIPLELPITIRTLSEALGIRSVDLLFKLRDQAGAMMTINSSVEPETAEAMALECGAELEIKRPLDAEGQYLKDLETPDNPEDLVLRAPIVTIMGHVDHGKTSLLDKIRSSNVASTEAGGITQVIRAWRVGHKGHFITFLDTPGHEAFTDALAGANVTDIAVIVVAADDGVMPQTEEAISHAKAAGVPIVVAVNKVDLPNANLNRTRTQLYNLQLIPDNMGGDVPFVETSAATGKGVDELLENLTVVAETLLELKANPNKSGRGTCLEAMLSEGEGVLATLLVRDGTLHRGDIVACGPAYGRVRAMYDDLGRPIAEAGPSVPVRITGLDTIPNADDAFFVVNDLAEARGIAEKRKARLQESALFRREPLRLEAFGEVKFTELKVILKADFRGSIEAIRKEMEKLQHEEVRVRILHAALGAITESDVQLALASPHDTMILGFNVVPDDRAKSLAEEKGIPIRQYDVIYHLTNDIRSAMEGKLKPREEVIQLGRAVIRETFKISRVGTIAGCYVTQGTIERSAKVRLIREGVVIYPPADRTAGLASLKRFKDDVREVREGQECGMKIAGYDDVKVGDVIEAFRIDQIQRTL